MAEPIVSVVVPTFRRPELLARCLDALLAQDLAAGEFEIIVADNAADPATRRAVESRRGRGPFLRYLAVDRVPGPAAARNRGWRAARARIIAFTDDDCIPEPDWLSQGLVGLAGRSAGVQGRVIVPVGPRPTDFEANTARLEDASCSTASFFCRKDALRRVGGFDERFKKAWREDSDLCWSLVESGLPVGRWPRSAVRHPPRPAAWGASLSQQKNNLYEALLYKKHPRPYRRDVGALPPAYAAAVAALTAAAAGAVLDRPRLARASLCIWGALTGRFFARRQRGRPLTPSHVAEMAVTSLLIPPLAVFWRAAGAVKFRVLFY